MPKYALAGKELRFKRAKTSSSRKSKSGGRKKSFGKPFFTQELNILKPYVLSSSPSSAPNSSVLGYEDDSDHENDEREELLACSDVNNKENLVNVSSNINKINENKQYETFTVPLQDSESEVEESPDQLIEKSIHESPKLCNSLLTKSLSVTADCIVKEDAAASHAKLPVSKSSVISVLERSLEEYLNRSISPQSNISKDSKRKLSFTPALSAKKLKQRPLEESPEIDVTSVSFTISNKRNGNSNLFLVQNEEVEQIEKKEEIPESDESNDDDNEEEEFESDLKQEQVDSDQVQENRISSSIQRKKMKQLKKDFSSQTSSKKCNQKTKPKTFDEESQEMKVSNRTRSKNHYDENVPLAVHVAKVTSPGKLSPKLKKLHSRDYILDDEEITSTAVQTKPKSINKTKDSRSLNQSQLEVYDENRKSPKGTRSMLHSDRSHSVRHVESPKSWKSPKSSQVDRNNVDEEHNSKHLKTSLETSNTSSESYHIHNSKSKRNVSINKSSTHQKSICSIEEDETDPVVDFQQTILVDQSNDICNKSSPSKKSLPTKTNKNRRSVTNHLVQQLDTVVEESHSNSMLNVSRRTRSKQPFDKSMSLYQFVATLPSNETATAGINNIDHSVNSTVLSTTRNKGSTATAGINNTDHSVNSTVLSTTRNKGSTATAGINDTDHSMNSTVLNTTRNKKRKKPENKRKSDTIFKPPLPPNTNTKASSSKVDQSQNTSFGKKTRKRRPQLTLPGRRNQQKKRQNDSQTENQSSNQQKKRHQSDSQIENQSTQEDVTMNTTHQESTIRSNQQKKRRQSDSQKENQSTQEDVTMNTIHQESTIRSNQQKKRRQSDSQKENQSSSPLKTLSISKQRRVSFAKESDYGYTTDTADDDYGGGGATDVKEIDDRSTDSTDVESDVNDVIPNFIRNERLQGGEDTVVEFKNVYFNSLDTAVVHRPASSVNWIPARGDDSLVMLHKYFTDDAVALGQIKVVPKGEKGMQKNKYDRLFFFVLMGNLRVTIQGTTFSVIEGGTFVVPEGNRYNIVNEADVEARLLFFQMKKIYNPTK